MMIVRSFLPVFSLMAAVISHQALGAVKAEHIHASVAHFMTDYSAKLADQYGNTARVEYKIGNLDPRLSMADCPQALSTQLKSLNSVGKINVQVSCQKTAIWSLYVPVNISLYRPVVSLVTPVAKGTLLSQAQLRLQDIDISRLNGTYFTAIDQVAGMQSKRPLRADSPILADHLQAPIMIKRGDAVLMTARSGSLVVKIPGVALADGHHGEQISIRNSQSKRVVEARVTAPGQVAVVM